MSGTRGRSGGFNRKTIQEHRLAGTFRPSRHAHLEVLPGRIVPVAKPAFLSAGAGVVWDDLAPTAERLGTLTKADVRAFATLCELESTRVAASPRKTEEGWAVYALRVERDTARALLPYFEMFGLTPGSRARLHIPNEQPATSRLDKFRNTNRWAGALK